METLVLYPSPGMGHLISMVELGKFILHHHPSFSISIIIVPPSFNTGSTAEYIRHISTTVPSITFHHLPVISLDLDTFPSMEAIIFEVLRRSNPHVRRALETIARSATISAFIIDFFCTTAQPIATELNIPTYYFLTSGASILAFFLYFPVIDRTTTKNFKEMNTLLDIPGVPPIPSSDMVRPLLDRTASDYKDFLEFFMNLQSSAGVLINTFETLETNSLKAMREGKCNPDGPTPPVYCVGPLLATQDKKGGSGGGAHDCLKFLDKQPSKSVLYLCFGSLGLLSAAQLRELAQGLERSGHRFLWVVRSPPSDDKSKRFLRPPEPDLDSLLPIGFLDRTKDQGLVVKSWAPQVEVLNHGSVGGFVTHCGWNSVLEAVWAGVPMVAWPLYAEQHYNRVVMVEDMKVALRVEQAEDGFVAAEELEKRVKELMDGEPGQGKEIREVVKQRSVEARAAMADEGSSVAALRKLVELWKSR